MSLPYFPMYPGDFEAKTSHLTLAEDGAYNRLLRISWMSPGCSIPNDEAWIFRRVRAFTEEDKAAVRAVLAEFFEEKAGRLVNPRLAREWLAATDAHTKRVQAGAKGGKAKALKTKEPEPSKAKAMLKQPEPEPEPLEERDKSLSHVRSETCPPFAEFWSAWGAVGGKIKKSDAERAWRKLSAKDRSQALSRAVEWYHQWRAANPRAAPIHASSYLNQQRWTDEFPQPGGPGNGHTARPAPRQAAETERVDRALERARRRDVERGSGGNESARFGGMAHGPDTDASPPLLRFAHG